MPWIILRAAAIAVLALGSAATAQVTVRGSGSTFIAPAIDAWGAAFAAANPGRAIAYRAVGSGDGVRDFVAGRTDFGATERPMRDEEIALIPEGVLHVPVSAGMVVVAYNVPGMTGQLRLSRKTLAGVFSGEIDHWDDPRIAADNPGLRLPRRNISLVARRDGSGTTFAFASHLGAIAPDFATKGPGVNQLPDWPRGTMTAYGNEGVAGRIAVSEYSIGYVEYGFARRLGIPVAALENRAGVFVSPSADSGAAAVVSGTGAMLGDGRLTMADPESAEAYPVVTLVWLLLRERQDKPEVAQTLRDFVNLALGQGQSTAAEIGYVPLPGPAILRAQVLAERMR